VHLLLRLVGEGEKQMVEEGGKRREREERERDGEKRRKRGRRERKRGGRIETQDIAVER